MANPKHLDVLKQGVDAWNKWRWENPEITAEVLYPDLVSADLKKADLRGADLTNVDLSGADLCGAKLSAANFRAANLSGANLGGARLVRVDLTNAKLAGASLAGAELDDIAFTRADLTGADFAGAVLGFASFGDNDLSRTLGLEAVEHFGPSTLGIDTIYKSRGEIPEVFLRGCGVPEEFITYMRSLTVRPVQFHSCFISYSGEDGGFARRLYSRMQQAGLRVWFALEDMKGGDKIYDQIDRAIQVHDRLLLVLSESSMRSKWVEVEIRRARKVELRENRRKLFPIRLVSYETLKEWVCIDSATGEDLAEEVRSYFIPDFSNWKSHDDFEQAFTRLHADLKASA